MKQEELTDLKIEIYKLLKEHKLKIIDEDKDSISFSIKNIEASIQIEDDNEYQFWVKEVYNIDLPENYYNDMLEYGDIHDFENFIMAIKDGDFNYIKSIYNSLLKLQETYQDDFSNMVKYFT